MPSKPTADRLRTAIRQAERRGVTRYQIAKASGVSEAQLSRIMSGDVSPRLDTADAIAKAIGVRITLVKK